MEAYALGLERDSRMQAEHLSSLAPLDKSSAECPRVLGSLIQYLPTH